MVANHYQLETIMSVIFEHNVAYMEDSQSAVYLSMDSNGFAPGHGTPAPIKKLVSALDVAPWGEDNRFPQNIVSLMDYCGVGKAALDLKARALRGQGIVPVTIKAYEDGGKTEIVEALDRNKFKMVYDFIESRAFYRFYLEFLRDWTWYWNCFPEMILSNDGKKITGMVHQESCDCRFKQMNETGNIDTVYLSKLWGMAKDQFVKFDPDRIVRGLTGQNSSASVMVRALTGQGTKKEEIDGKFLKEIACIDMYNPVESLKKIAEKLKDKSGLKSAILPVNYPSHNKTYYQLSDWDGARLSGWIEIAGKIPAMFKAIYNKAFNIKYHISIPWSYFVKKYETKFTGADQEGRRRIIEEELRVMDKFLSGSDKGHQTFVSFFDVDPTTREGYGLINIKPVESKATFEKDLIASQAANSEIMFAMGMNPDSLGIGAPGGPYSGSAGSGSNLREAKLVYDNGLHLERQVTLEPLYLVRDYNNWGAEIQFRHRDIALTTLDKGKGTEKTLS